jgi:hypothetical protein
MSLNINSEETYRSALARLTGESMTAAVTVAIRERPDRVRRERTTGLAVRLLAIGSVRTARHGSRSRSDLPITETCFTTNSINYHAPLREKSGFRQSLRPKSGLSSGSR